jgi:DNA-3-methyladenine glycosylase
VSTAGDHAGGANEGANDGANDGASTSATIAATIAELRAARLPRAFYQDDPATVARGLLGCALVHGERAGLVVETEAYLGPADQASHARFGNGKPTGRNAVMFGAGGVAYVYLCYGVHEMFNVVTGLHGEPGAVLVRAIAPLSGLPDDPAVGRGPGKVTRALGLHRRHTGLPLDGDELFLAATAQQGRLPVVRGPRVGVAYAGAWAARLLRFAVAGHPSVSRPAPTARQPRPRRGA